ncbi:hypothetical protein CEXT_792611 [Caerostris extrusa]|uniref:Uncharacterized protein n=1 Tax=Caerostris extrusa TaxID=172846 RepID=A0AAV4MAC2_CAEEX|nr:hypothetical protein CEXT_792611 [Caerostris extrusa]
MHPAPISIDLNAIMKTSRWFLWGHLLTGPKCHFIRTSADLLTVSPALSTVMRIDKFLPLAYQGMVTTAASTNCRSPSCVLWSGERIR